MSQRIDPRCWTIHVCEDHGIIDCDRCGVFDVIRVVRDPTEQYAARPSAEQVEAQYGHLVAGIPAANETDKLLRVARHALTQDRPRVAAALTAINAALSREDSPS